MVELRHNHGNITGMIARRRLLLFVGTVMLLVNNDESEAIERKEDRGPDTNDKLQLATQDTVPDFYAFVIREPGMIHSHACAEDFFQALYDLCRECDFRKEIKYLRIALQGLPDQADIYLCFTAASDAVQQRGCMRFKTADDGVQGFFLIFTEQYDGRIANFVETK